MFFGFVDMMYLMIDFVYIIISCLCIIFWEFFYWKFGYIDFMVWRLSGSKYKLLGYNSIYVLGRLVILKLLMLFKIRY